MSTRAKYSCFLHELLDLFAERGALSAAEVSILTRGTDRRWETGGGEHIVVETQRYLRRYRDHFKFLRGGRGDTGKFRLAKAGRERRKELHAELCRGVGVRHLRGDVVVRG